MINRNQRALRRARTWQAAQEKHGFADWPGYLTSLVIIEDGEQVWQCYYESYTEALADAFRRTREEPDRS